MDLEALAVGLADFHGSSSAPARGVLLLFKSYWRRKAGESGRIRGRRGDLKYKGNKHEIDESQDTQLGSFPHLNRDLGIMTWTPTV